MNGRRAHWGVLLVLIAFRTTVSVGSAQAQPDAERFAWPDGALAAVSLSFDDARESQVELGVPLFERFDAVKATFYVMPGPLEGRLAGWQWLAADGHEIGNHSVRHPCSGNFRWAREMALEEYTLEKMEQELSEANDRIEDLLGVEPVSFAYPCGQTYVGRGIHTRSYVPLIADLFESGRGWLDEAPNDPAYADLAQLTGMSMDGTDFDEIRALLEQAKASGAWLILAGHEIDTEGPQTTRVEMLEQLLAYASDPENGIWMAPVGTVGRYVAEQRAKAAQESRERD